MDPAASGKVATHLLTHAQMYHIADKYFVDGLKDLAKEKFRRSCAHFWNDADFADVITYACESTPDTDMGLRDIIVESIITHPEVLKKPSVIETLSNNGDIAVRALRKNLQVD